MPHQSRGQYFQWSNEEQRLDQITYDLLRPLRGFSLQRNNGTQKNK